MKEIEHQLTYPITANGVKINTIKIRRPTVGDSLAADCLQESDTAKEVYLLANLCEISPEDIKKLDLKDYVKIQRICENFLA